MHTCRYSSTMEKLWSVYVDAVAPREQHRQEDIAEASGVTQATVSRWLNGKVVPDRAVEVAAFAKAYGRNVLEAFVAAGLLSEDEIGRGLPASSRRYLAELRERSAEEEGARAAVRTERARRQRADAPPARRSRQLGDKKVAE